MLGEIRVNEHNRTGPFVNLKVWIGNVLLVGFYIILPSSTSHCNRPVLEKNDCFSWKNPNLIQTQPLEEGEEAWGFSEPESD